MWTRKLRKGVLTALFILPNFRYLLIEGFQLTSLKFQLENYWSSQDFTFMIYTSWKLVFIQIFTQNGSLQHGISIQISINSSETFLRIGWFKKMAVTWILARGFAYLPSFFSQILHFICWTLLIFISIYFEWRDTENQQLLTTNKSLNQWKQFFRTEYTSFFLIWMNVVIFTVNTVLRTVLKIDWVKFACELKSNSARGWVSPQFEWNLQ